MENIQKALQMAVAVFLFIIAATSSIFLYNRLINNSKDILIISDINRSSAEYVASNSVDDVDREINRDEVIFTILDIENNSSYLDKIVISYNGKYFEFYSDSSLASNNKNEFDYWMMTDTNKKSIYSSSYDDDNMTLKYIHKK